MIQMALKRPAEGHLLAAGNAGLSDPREHGALGEAILGYARHLRQLFSHLYFELELELEAVQFQMAQKPVLRGEVGARALRVRSMSREEAWASAGVKGDAFVEFEAL